MNARDASPELRELNKKVTAAIMRAEHLPPGREAQVAFREVSRIEEEIARSTAADSLEGSIARRGAIAAALSAGDWLRALGLAEVYLAEPAPADLADELAALRDEARILVERAMSADRERARRLIRELNLWSARADTYGDGNEFMRDQEAIAHALAEAQPRWIPCSERLPELGEWLLLWVAGDVNEIQFGQHDGDGKWWAFYRNDPDKISHEPIEVTHWMPLPSPPEQVM